MSILEQHLLDDGSHEFSIASLPSYLLPVIRIKSYYGMKDYAIIISNII